MPTITLDITPETERELLRLAKSENAAPETLQNAAMTALLAGLRNRRIPQTLEELAPAVPLPPGETLKDLMEAFWRDFPDENTDEEVERILAENKKEKAD